MYEPVKHEQRTAPFLGCSSVMPDIMRTLHMYDIGLQFLVKTLAFECPLSFKSSLQMRSCRIKRLLLSSSRCFWNEKSVYSRVLKRNSQLTLVLPWKTICSWNTYRFILHSWQQSVAKKCVTATYEGRKQFYRDIVVSCKAWGPIFFFIQINSTAEYYATILLNDSMKFPFFIWLPAQHST